MKILFITLSNIGDCILTLPVLDALRRKYPQGLITCLVPPRPKEIFINNPAIEKVIIFDKHSRMREKIKLFFSLSREGFDEVVDLRNSFFGAFLPAKKRSSPLRIIPGGLRHMKDRHLYRAGLSGFVPDNSSAKSIAADAGDKKYIEDILTRKGISGTDKLIVVAPGARSDVKRWDKENFRQLCRRLGQEEWQIVLVGDAGDKPVCDYIREGCAGSVIDLCAKTTISQLAALLIKARLLITNDSAVMHLASYLNIPVAAIFGPTDEKKYGPWSEKSIVIKKDIFCRPCAKAQCSFGKLVCLPSVRPEDVLEQVKSLLSDKVVFSRETKEKQYSRILIVRTDRIGDVLLSTPVIKALRQKFPQAYISMMVSPYARDIVEGNPYLDEVIVYDKDGKHKSFFRSLKFSSRLRKKKFDLAIILHPANRAHLLTFLAGIPERLGYNRKLGFLLTRRIEHTKQKGQKHEAEYNLELLSELGITGNPLELFMPVRDDSEKWAQELFVNEGIRDGDKVLAINPGASCPSKVWPAERFAEAAEKLAERYNFKILILGGPKDMRLADKVEQGIKGKAINLSGKTSVSQMASLLKRSRLFISNDSGPVHIASALGTPVISIFGRAQAGLSPRRWGPLGKRDKYLHKEIGCIQCLAHNCVKEFACLKAIGVSDVLAAAESILK
ncbi:MAG: lipopolysaccharide heptosyltransferase II [Candidatus Omnitrophica bacterium]|nr:lipopolysaccharide heptosyltransferase II [Candidatus Omnitrophota bacterium]